jgi:ComF family protein
LGGVGNVVQALADFWLDDICHACGRLGDAFAALPRPRDAAAAALAQPLRIGGARLGVDTRPLCRACCHDLLPMREPVTVGHLSVWPAFETDARILAVVHALKFSRRERLGAWLARAMAEGLPARALHADDSAPLLVPVPMDRASLRHRGFNQAERLATALAALCGGRVERRAIVKVRRTAAQSILGSAERAHNVAGAMEVGTRDAVRGRRVVLVDDLVTTGATAAACTLALGRAGAREVRVVCVGYRP